MFSLSKRREMSKVSSEGRRGWMYSEDMRREASIFSMSGELLEETAYGCSFSVELGRLSRVIDASVNLAWISVFSSAISSEELRSACEIRGMMLVTSTSCLISDMPARSDSRCTLVSRQKRGTSYYLWTVNTALHPPESLPNRSEGQ